MSSSLSLSLTPADFTRVGRDSACRPDATQTVPDNPAGETLRFPTSNAFAGALRTGHGGSLKIDHIVSFRTPVAGALLDH
jgi:hypothetical protein